MKNTPVRPKMELEIELELELKLELDKQSSELPTNKKFFWQVAK